MSVEFDRIIDRSQSVPSFLCVNQSKLLLVIWREEKLLQFVPIA